MDVCVVYVHVWLVTVVGDLCRSFCWYVRGLSGGVLFVLLVAPRCLDR